MIFNYNKTNFKNLYKIIDKNNLIGIGEEAHGELTSWKYRYNIIKHYTDYIKKNNINKKIIIFVENIDIYTNELNHKNCKFNFYNNFFYPNLIAGSERTKEHLKITKKFNKLIPYVKFIGIDIQIVEYFNLKKKDNINPLLFDLLQRYKKDYLKNTSGANRNKFNSLIIKNLMKKINYYKCFYFAHNGHVALHQYNIRSKTDGYYLSNYKNINYLCIFTDSLLLNNIMHCIFQPKEKCKSKNYKHKYTEKYKKLFNKNNFIILNNNKEIKYYSSDDNHYLTNIIILDKESPIVKF